MNIPEHPGTLTVPRGWAALNSELAQVSSFMVVSQMQGVDSVLERGEPTCPYVMS